MRLLWTCLVFAWLVPAPAVAEEDLPVVLLHGWNSGAAAMAPIANLLEEHGRRVVIPDFTPPWPGSDLRELAHEAVGDVEDALADLGLDPAAARFDLVGFSVGGLLARLLVDDGGGYVEPVWKGRVRRVVLVASPVAGTPSILADLACHHLPDHLWAGVACDLAGDSPLWQRLPDHVRADDGAQWFGVAVRRPGGDGVVSFRSSQLAGVDLWSWEGQGLSAHVLVCCNSWVVERVVDAVLGNSDAAESSGHNAQARNLCHQPG